MQINTDVMHPILGCLMFKLIYKSGDACYVPRLVRDDIWQFLICACMTLGRPIFPPK